MLAALTRSGHGVAAHQLRLLARRDRGRADGVQLGHGRHAVPGRAVRRAHRGRAGDVLRAGGGRRLAGAVLKSPVFREKLQHELNNLAEDGARRAAPVVAEAVRNIAITDALALIKGGKTAATTYLRQAMGPALVNAMIPELDQAMRLAENPILNQAISALSGVSITDAELHESTHKSSQRDPN